MTDDRGGDASRTRGGTLAELVGAARVPRRAAIGARGWRAAGRHRGPGGVTHDSRRVRPGFRVRGHPGRPSRRSRSRARGGGRRCRGAGPGAGRADAGRAPGAGRGARAARWPSRAAWFEGDPSHRPGRRGHHGHRRQDDDRLSRALDARGGRPADRACWAPSMSSSAARAWATPGVPRRPRRPSSRRTCAQMVDAGDRWAVVESTSHGLAQDRVGEVA